MDTKRPTARQKIPSHATKVFTGKVFSVFQWEQELYDGTMTIFESLTRADTVNVLPITDDKKIILTEQEQPGVEQFISSPGGIVDPGETPLDAAKRELLEETGYTAEEFILWDAVQPAGRIDWAIFTYFAKGCKQIHATPQLDGGEKISLLYVTFDEFVQLVADERYRDTDIALKILRALPDPKKIEAIKKLFFS